MFTFFYPRHVLGPVSYLSQVIKEVVCFIQTKNLRETTITHVRILIIMEMMHVAKIGRNRIKTKENSRKPYYVF